MRVEGRFGFLQPMAKGTSKKQPPPAKRWVFTVNNPPDDWSLDTEAWEYLIYGHEVGEQGTPHIQGFGVLKGKKRRTAVAKLIPNAYLDKAHGTNEQNTAYCSKGNNITTHGTQPKDGAQKTKEHWDHWLAAAKAGNFDEIPAKILMKHFRTCQALRQEYMPKPPDLPPGTVCGVWIWGPRNVGKSHYVREHWPDLFDKNLNKWWDGYREQTAVLLEDVDKSQVNWLPNFMKRWVDRYSFPAEIKGTTRQIRPKEIIVTSNYSLSKWLSMKECQEGDRELFEAVSRRFKVYHMPERGVLNEADGVVPVLTGSGFDV